MESDRAVRRFWDNFYLLLAVMMLIWASTASIVTWLFKPGQELRTAEVVVFDIGFAFLALLVITLLSGEKRRSLRQYRWSQVPALVIVAFVGIYAYLHMFYESLHANVADVTPYVIINYIWPLTVIVFGVLILKEKLTVYTWVGGACGFLGFLLIQVAKVMERPEVSDAWTHRPFGEFLGTFASSMFGDAEAAGCLLALGAGVSWGLFSALARKWSDRYRFNAVSSMMLFTGLGLAMALAVLGRDVRWGYVFGRVDVLLLLLLLGGWSHGAANVLWLRAIKVGGAGRTGVVSYLLPVLSLALVAIVHRQVPSPWSAVGLALILGAIILAETHRRGRQGATNAASVRNDFT